MAAPFKRICLRAAQQHAARQPQQYLVQQSRHISRTAANPASLERGGKDEHGVRPFELPRNISDAELDQLASQPGVKYTTTEMADDIGSLEIDALSAYAQNELEQHRELREMVRLAAWEMPMLAEHSRPFEKPSKAQMLRWRYTTYMGESHPAQNKVVLEFRVDDLKEELTAEQREKLIKLVGVRFTPHTGMVKMSSESFENPAQNKRYLVDTLKALIAEAADPNADSFADIPRDERHVKWKQSTHFPREWRMTPERKAELEAKRNQQLLSEGRKVEQGLIVSGVAALETARQKQAERELELKREQEEQRAKEREAVVMGARPGRPNDANRGRRFAM